MLFALVRMLESALVPRDIPGWSVGFRLGAAVYVVALLFQVASEL
jgi:hypothetical protein